jgi:hypothetical protein
MRGSFRNRAFVAELVLDFFRRISSSVMTVVRIAAGSVNERSSLPSASADKLVILATGPSLKTSLADLEVTPFANIQFMSVNDYFKEQSFKFLQPVFHVIADPIYWDDSCFEEYAEPLLQGMQSASWNITVFLPNRGRHSKLHRNLMSRNIRFVFYATTTLSGFRHLVFAAFARRLGMPKAQNVLVPAISIALWLNYKLIALLGADHSWHQEIEVDTANTLLVRQVHSYDGLVEKRPFYKPQGIGKLASSSALESRDTFSMREILSAWATMHESYEQLSQIAKSMGVCVVNSSTVSFIDAFERRAIAEVVAGKKDAKPNLMEGDSQCGRI